MPSHQDPIDVAARALHRRDRSRHDVDGRLARAGVDEVERARALDTLERIGYLDDDRFAAGRADALASRGYGDAAIRADLERQGVDGERLQAALAALEPEQVRARRVVERLGPGLRSAGRLARKGFDDDTIQELLGDGGPWRADAGADDPSVV